MFCLQLPDIIIHDFVINKNIRHY